MTKPHLFIQVLLLSAIVPSKLAVDCPTVTRGSTDDAHHLFKEDDTVQMPHTPTLLSSASFTNFGWQRGATTAEPGEGLLKPLQRSGQLGLDIATDAMTKPHLFIQVNLAANFLIRDTSSPVNWSARPETSLIRRPRYRILHGEVPRKNYRE
uniref:Putative secreted protein n=1 Tax=Ixodes ricinus TaxID=34613 RepID=A0A6B0UVH2_IXORI